MGLFRRKRRGRPRQRQYAPPDRAPAPPRAESPTGGDETPPVVTAPPPLSGSPDVEPEQLKAALEEMARHPIADWEVDRVARVVGHADPEIRLAALRALGSQSVAAAATIRERLEDPDDAVRAEAVRATRGAPIFLRDLVWAVANRHWPAAQAEALAILPAALKRWNLRKEDLPALAEAVAAMPSSPVARERAAFGSIAHTIGIERLASALREGTCARLGLARLLLVEGSTDALRAVAGLIEDPDPGIRSAAAAAAGLLHPSEAITVLDGAPPSSGEGPADLAPPEKEHLLELATDLQSTDDAARDRALAELGELGWEKVVSWTRETLRRGDFDEAAAAAAAAERLLLRQVAPLLLERAAGLPTEDRGPYVRALAALGTEGEWLLGLLPQVDSALRGTAMTILWETGGPDLVEHVSSSLPEMPPDVRTAVLELAAVTSDPEPMDLAFTLLTEDLLPRVRVQAAGALAAAGPGRRLEALELAIGDPDPGVRRAAIEHLTPEGSEADRHLLAALDDPDDGVADAAIPHLVERLETEPATAWAALRRAEGPRRTRLERELASAGRRGLLRLARQRLRSPDEEDRLLATEIVVERHPEQAGETAAQMLTDPSTRVRILAANALRGGAGDRGTVDALREAAEDPSPDVRAEALHALADHGEEWCVGPLIDGLTDPDLQVRTVARERLRKMSSRGLARRLIAALGRPDTRPPAADLLAGMGRFVEDLLIEAAPDSDEETRRSIGALLERSVGIDEYARRLTSLDRDRRSQAVDAIAAIGSPEAIELLSRSLVDPDERIRVQVIARLAEMSDATAVEALRKTAEQDPVAEVVQAAREALSRLAAQAAGSDDPAKRSGATA